MARCDSSQNCARPERFSPMPAPANLARASFSFDGFPDFWISDRYGGQMGWAKREHQVCLAHLIRDVQ